MRSAAEPYSENGRVVATPNQRARTAATVPARAASLARAEGAGDGGEGDGGDVDGGEGDGGEPDASCAVISPPPSPREQPTRATSASWRRVRPCCREGGRAAWSPGVRRRRCPGG